MLFQKKSFKIASLLGGLCLAAVSFADEIVTDADNDQVVFLGDSIFALSEKIQANIEATSGETYRNYTLSGSQMFGGGLGMPIPDQFQRALGDNPDIDLVVMNGGGNDILVPAIVNGDPHQCKTRWYQFGRLSQSCKDFVDTLYLQGMELLETYTQYGVENIVYLGYYYTKLGLAGNLNTLRQAVDYGDETLQRACDNSPIPCTFVDPRSTIRPWDVSIDGIHPNDSGSKKLADLIWPVMQPLL